MPKGRKKVPDGINALRGNPGKRKRLGVAPAFTSGAQPPKWLSKYAREEWDLVAGELATLGMLDTVCTTVLAGYCEAAGQIRQATEIIKRRGLTIKCGIDGAKPHPAVAMRSDAIKIVKAFAAEFGFTPSSKASINLAPPEEDKLHTFLKVHSA